MIGRKRLGEFGSNRMVRDARGITRIVALAVALALAACSPPAETEHKGHGTAVEIDRTARTVTLDHEDIPGLMMGMTMTFPVAPGVDLESVAKGAIVDFRVKSDGKAITVTAIHAVAP